MPRQKHSSEPPKSAPQKKEEPHLSVVVPVFNEEACLEEFFARLMPVLEDLQESYEVIFVNDGSRDQTELILMRFFAQDPRKIRVINFNRNYGQYMALLAGFTHVRGEVVVTLDADLQNPPEEIPNLLREITSGHDLVGSYRRERHDSFFRTESSRAVNWLRARLTGMEEMRDHGCMLRACQRSIVDQVVEIKEFSAYISVLMQRFALNPIDIAVEHCERAHSTSKYSLFKLIRITFDLITGASAAPLRIFTFLGMGSACLGILLVLYAGIRHFLSGPEMEGWFAVFAILFFFLSIMAFGIGLIGEYIGRMYFSVCQYPRFVIRSIIEEPSSEERKEKK